jgi:AraC-like DNA-binding protein
MSVFKKIFYGCMLIVFTILVVVDASVFFYLQSLYKQQIVGNAAKVAKNLNAAFNGSIEQMNLVVAALYADPERERALRAREFTTEREEYDNQTAMRRYMDQLFYLVRNFSSIYIYLTPTRSYSYSLFGRSILGYDPEGQDWYRKTVAAGGRVVIFGPHLPFHLHSDRRVISLARLLKSYDQTPLGVLLIDIGAEALRETVESTLLGRRVQVPISDRERFFCSSEGEVGAPTPEREQELGRLMDSGRASGESRVGSGSYLYARSSSEVTGWQILTVMPSAVVTEALYPLMVFDVVMVVVGLGSAVAAIAERKRAGYGVSVVEIRQYIEAHYSEPLSLSSVAESFLINPAYLSRLFKAQSGEDFHEYLGRLRLEAACSLLQSTGLPVQKVAETVGMENEHYFYSKSKKLLGCTPAEYRKRSQAGGGPSAAAGVKNSHSPR